MLDVDVQGLVVIELQGVAVANGVTLQHIVNQEAVAIVHGNGPEGVRWGRLTRGEMQSIAIGSV